MTNLPEEIQDELRNLLERLVAAANGDQDDPAIFVCNTEDEAKDLLAKLPAPVNPDIEEARKLDKAWRESPKSLSTHYLALASLRRGRELERASQ